VEEDSRSDDKAEGNGRPESEREEIEARFPAVPPQPDAPEVPKLNPRLPPHPDRHPKSGAPAPGAYNKMALAATAASSFIMPIIVLAIIGWWLDNRMHHQTSWLAFIGVLAGLAIGTTSLVKIMNRLSD
jgi:hypothetical protein